MTFYFLFMSYSILGDDMKIYVDLVLLLNFGFDLILLFGVAIILRRQTNLFRLVLGGLLGSVTIFFMFIQVSSLLLFFIKIFISIGMVLVTFGYQNLKYTFKNLFYLYTSSILLGGFLYFLNLEFSYKNEGLIFYFDGLSVNVIVLIVLSPIIIYAYVKQGLLLKNQYSHYYNMDIYFRNGRILSVTAYLDTGNQLVDPYKRRPILLLNSNLLKIDYYKDNLLLVPYDAINYHGLLKCIIPDKIFIQGVGFRKHFLIGISNEKIKMEGIDCIIGNRLLERGSL